MNLTDVIKVEDINSIPHVRIMLKELIGYIKEQSGQSQETINALLNRVSTLEQQLSNARDKISDIEGVIPNQATINNKLTDKNFVNSSISTSTATFRGTFNSVNELENITIADANDYAFVVSKDASGNTLYNKYKYTKTGEDSYGWVLEYALNNSSFTANQWTSINSEITPVLVEVLKAMAEDMYYGVKINAQTGEITRIGKMEWHKTLPIQSKMRRCFVDGDNIIYINDSDYTKDSFGNDISAMYTGNVDLMVEMPEYWCVCYQEIENNVPIDYIKLYPYEHAGLHVPKHYIGAMKASVNRSTLTVHSIAKCGITYSEPNVVNGATDLTYADDAATYRGGSNIASRDEDSLLTFLGRPASSLNISTFTSYAKNRGAGYSIINWASRSNLYRLFIVEYANMNAQAKFNESLTVDGYHQGGLGEGPTDVSSGWDNNPVIPCGLTQCLGNKTGVVRFNFAKAIDSYTYTNAVSYRGVENPFGDIWELCNGIYGVGDSSLEHIFTAIDGWNVLDFRYGSSPSTPIEGYKKKGSIGTFSGSFITNWHWDNDGDFVPSDAGEQRSSIMNDAFWTVTVNNTTYRALVGGGLHNGAKAGIGCLSLVIGVAGASASNGSRLLYIPNL